MTHDNHILFLRIWFSVPTIIIYSLGLDVQFYIVILHKLFLIHFGRWELVNNNRFSV